MLFSHNYLHKSKSSSTFATDFRLCGLLFVGVVFKNMLKVVKSDILNDIAKVPA